MARVRLARIFRGSLAARFRAYTLAVMAPLALLGGMLLYQYWVEMPREALERALEVAEEGGHEIEDFLARTGKVLELLAHLPEVQGLQAEGVTRVLEGLEEHFPEYQGLFLVDGQGRIIAGYPAQRVGTAVGDRPYFQAALAAGRAAVSPVLTSRLTGGPLVMVAYPVLDGNGLPLGIVAAELDLGYMSASLSRAALGPDYRLAVFDGQGQLAFLRAPAGETADLVQCTRCHATSPPSPAEHTPPRAWVGEGRFHGLVTTSLGWHVLVNAPADAVLGAAQTRAELVLGLVLLILAVSVSVATVLGRRMARPILQLAEAARCFGAGEAVKPLVATSRDEVGDLVDSFNRTMEEIGEGRRRLEEKQIQLGTLHALDRAVSSTLSLQTLVDILAEQVQGLAGVEGVAIYLLQGREDLALAASKGLGTRLLSGEAGGGPEGVGLASGAGLRVQRRGVLS